MSSQKKNLLAIIPYAYQPPHAGGKKLITLLFDYLGRISALTLVSVKGMDTSKLKNYTFIPLLKASRSRYYDFSLVKKISRIIKEKEIETIIWEHPYYAWLAWLVKRKTKVKTIVQTQNIEFQRFRSMKKWWWPLLMRYERWCFRMADFIYFITPEDKAFAEKEWNIDPAKSTIVPYGIEISGYPDDKNECRQSVIARHSIPTDEKIFLFNGVLSYQPNIEALQFILEHINPILLQSELKYKILVCGNGLPAELNELKEYIDKNIIHAGFVEDINEYSKAADLLLNPVQSGGGIKTKMVEAIAFGTTVIATASGATGMDPLICGEKLFVVPDSDWKAFADTILEKANNKSTTPGAYYDYYFYGNIVQRLIKNT